jgi:hypothetical protein
MKRIGGNFELFEIFVHLILKKSVSYNHLSLQDFVVKCSYTNCSIPVRSWKKFMSSSDPNGMSCLKFVLINSVKVPYSKT